MIQRNTLTRLLEGVLREQSIHHHRRAAIERMVIRLLDGEGFAERRSPRPVPVRLCSVCGAAYQDRNEKSATCASKPCMSEVRSRNAKLQWQRWHLGREAKAQLTNGGER